MAKRPSSVRENPENLWGRRKGSPENGGEALQQLLRDSAVGCLC